MMFLPLICLIFLYPQFVFSSSKNSSPISAQWSSDCSANYGYSLCNLLETLTSQTSTEMYNFGSTPSNTPNQLHGLYMCRGDVDLQTCRSCIQSVKNDILEHMSCSFNGLIWYDHCMLRYSNESFHGKRDVNKSASIRSSSWSMRKIKGSRLLFMTILMKTMKDLAIKASDVENLNKFASKVVELPRNETLYATVQCTPDLLASDCYRCLTHASEKFLRMDGSVDGKAIYTSCMAEYKTTYANYYDEPSIDALPLSSYIDVTNSTLISVNGTKTDDANDTSEQAI